jgi:phosphoribosylformylglycinamidine cyclo-ligase
MLKTFNAGIGMVLVVRADAADAVAETLTDAGETVHRIGTVAPGRACGIHGTLA